MTVGFTTTEMIFTNAPYPLHVGLLIQVIDLSDGAVKNGVINRGLLTKKLLSKKQ